MTSNVTLLLLLGLLLFLIALGAAIWQIIKYYRSQNSSPSPLKQRPIPESPSQGSFFHTPGHEPHRDIDTFLNRARETDRDRLAQRPVHSGYEPAVEGSRAKSHVRNRSSGGFAGLFRHDPKNKPLPTNPDPEDSTRRLEDSVERQWGWRWSWAGRSDGGHNGGVASGEKGGLAREGDGNYERIDLEDGAHGRNIKEQKDKTGGRLSGLDFWGGGAS
jgi:hypothetical protein